MNRFILYGTLGCHLCELAEAQLAPLLGLLQQQTQSVEIECIDIAADDDLLQRYGESIPVLRRERDDRELRWPFAESALYDFLRDALLD
jgi:hypothetical protein